MIVRAVSNLPSIESQGLGLANELVLNSLIELSKPLIGDPDKFTSNNMRLSSITTGLSNLLYAKTTDDFDLVGTDGKNISLSSQVRRIDNLYQGNISISGRKEFKSYPYISAMFPIDETPYGSLDNVIPNLKKVKDVVRLQNPALVSTTSSYVTDGCPFKNLAGYELSDASLIHYLNTVGLNDTTFYMWNIQDGKRDSSETIWDKNSITRDDYEEMRDSGTLVVWGWVADRGVVAAHDAWVGIFTTMKCEGMSLNRMVEIPISIQPWIKGTYSSDFQYVGFTIPVKRGLRLKIKTGFNVGGANGGGHQEGNTLSFRDRYIPNTFFGYVIHND